MNNCLAFAVAVLKEENTEERQTQRGNERNNQRLRFFQ